MITIEQRQKLYAALAAPFPEEAIERTRAADTRRGYDTTGIRYQYVVNRLNEVLGVGGWRATATFLVREGRTAKDRVQFEALCELTLELGSYDDTGVWRPFAQALGIGGHVALAEVDARKGAHTNAFKKAAAFFGAGRQAYEGTLDEEPEAEPQRRPASAREEPVDATELAHWQARLQGCADKAAIDALWGELCRAYPRTENPLGLGGAFRRRVGEVQATQQRRAG